MLPRTPTIALGGRPRLHVRGGGSIAHAARRGGSTNVKQPMPPIVAPLDEIPIVGERERRGAGMSILKRASSIPSHNSAHRPMPMARRRRRIRASTEDQERSPPPSGNFEHSQHDVPVLGALESNRPISELSASPDSPPMRSRTPMKKRGESDDQRATLQPVEGPRPRWWPRLPDHARARRLLRRWREVLPPFDGRASGPSRRRPQPSSFHKSTRCSAASDSGISHSSSITG